MMKKLLIVTQKVDRTDSNLGFFHRWLEEFAEYADVMVIAGFVGKGNALPQNVRVVSLGKERGVSRVTRWVNFLRLFEWHSRDADAVFFHMIPEFVVAAWPILIFRKCRTALWYVHGSVPLWLRFAERIVDRIFTVNAASFHLPSKKIAYTGHAIDTEFFKPAEAAPPDALHFLTVGRISPVKKLETIIEACAIVAQDPSLPWMFSIVGGPIMRADAAYAQSLHRLAEKKAVADSIAWSGARPYPEMPALYQNHDIFISMSATGSMDKAVLEAMACGLSVITANEAFRDSVPPAYFLERREPALLAERILKLAPELRPNLELRAIVEKNHSLTATIQKIAQVLLS